MSRTQSVRHPSWRVFHTPVWEPPTAVMRMCEACGHVRITSVWWYPAGAVGGDGLQWQHVCEACRRERTLLAVIAE